MVKNSLEAGATVIELTIKNEDKLLNMQIIDNGRGVDKNINLDIFKPYVSSKTKGMGLGLFIVLKTIKALHGNIEMVSANPGNTSFKIELPEGK